MNIIPQPRETEIIQGEYIFKGKYFVDKNKFPKVYKYLKVFTDISDDAEKIVFNLDNKLKREEYILLIDEYISITARDEEGIFRAVSTLKQLAVMGTVEKQKIHDYPMIKNRGIMLDISRGRIPKTENLKKIIDLMRDVKYNQLQLYMDGLVFEYEHFKKHIEGKDVLTIDEMRDIKQYCVENYIELVPNQNGFGHMEKWLELPEFADLAIMREDGGKNDTLNPFDNRSIEFVDTLYSDLIPYFNSKYMNIGMDEPSTLGTGQTKEQCDKLGKDAVYIDYLNKIIKLCNEKYEKIPMIWDDILFEKPECIEKIKGDCVVMDWGYEADSPFVARCEYLSRKGLKFYTSPGTSTWGSYTGRFDNMIYNIESAVKSCIHYNGEGMILTDWGDGGHPQCIAMSFIPYVFAAACAWNYKSDIFDFSYFKKVEIIQYVEEYLDKFVFEGRTVSKILHKMANYYLFETQNRFNETFINSDKNAYLSDKIIQSGYTRPRLTEKEAINIENYMRDLKDELLSLDNDTPYIDDIILNCDMVILTAGFIRESILNDGGKICNNELKVSFMELKERFERLWLASSKKTGCEIFMKNLDKIISKFD